MTALVISVVLAIMPDSVDELLRTAQLALARNHPDEALALANKAVSQNPDKTSGYFIRGVAFDLLQKYGEAVAEFDQTIKRTPKVADVYLRRGGAHFKLGHMQEAIKDFDQFVKLEPDKEPGCWQRGICYYYAGRFDEGRKQFEGYEKVDSNDVENAVWRYLCMARLVGVEKARADLLKIGNDRRVPMMQVYALFAGKAKPEDVVAAANAGTPTKQQLNERLFYTHLYLGLYYEAAGDKKRALEHMSKAAEDYKWPGHYMWDVARVHCDLRRNEAKTR